MFRRVMRLLGVLSVWLLAVLPALAQDDWFVLLFSNVTNTITRVNPDGAQESYALDLPPDTYLSARDMAYSPDGSQVSFCTIQYGADGSDSTVTFVTQNLLSGGKVLEQDLGSAIGCRVVANEDASQLAVGLIRYYPIDESADTSLPAWELFVLDAATGETLETLNADSMATAAMTYQFGEAFLPYVFRFEGGEIIFGELPYGTDGINEIPAYAWQLDTDTIAPAPEWGRIMGDYLPSTGEFVWLSRDTTLPVGEPFGPVPPNNVVYVTDAAGETQMVYHSPDWILVDAVFVNNGEQLALHLTESVDPSAPEPSFGVRWVLLDRSGVVTELFTTDAFATLVPAPDGYVALIAEGNPAERLTLRYGGADGIIDLWTTEIGADGDVEGISYVTPFMPAEDLPPFTPVTP